LRGAPDLRFDRPLPLTAIGSRSDKEAYHPIAGRANRSALGGSGL